MMPKFVDIHHHLAYGVDDGPQNRKQMYRMLDRAAAQGIHTIFATSHITPGVRRFNMEGYRKAVEEARAYCASSGYDMKIYEGCEILYTGQSCRLLQSGKVPTLAGTDFVLVEFSPDVRFSRLHDALQSLASAGYRPIVAHAERYRCLTMWPSRTVKLRDEMDVYFQINCMTLLREKGFRVRRFTEWMLEHDMVDALGTDAHNTSSRRANMKAAWKYLKWGYGSKYARQLTTGAFMSEELAELSKKERKKP